MNRPSARNLMRSIPLERRGKQEKETMLLGFIINQRSPAEWEWRKMRIRVMAPSGITVYLVRQQWSWAKEKTPACFRAETPIPSLWWYQLRGLSVRGYQIRRSSGGSCCWGLRGWLYGREHTSGICDPDSWRWPIHRTVGH